MLLSATALAGCGGAVERLPPPLPPYHGYFEAFDGEETFLFADLEQKIDFDIAPARPAFKEYLSRVGRRVFVSDEVPGLRPRIVRGYEMAHDTRLTAVDDIDAPPPATPPTATTRRSLPEGDAPVVPPMSGGEALDAAQVGDGDDSPGPATRGRALPLEELGPTGEPADGVPPPVDPATIAPSPPALPATRPVVDDPNVVPAPVPITPPATLPAKPSAKP